MPDAMKALDQIGAKVGIGAALFVGWMYFQVQDIRADVDKLDTTTKELAEMRSDISAINAKLEMIINNSKILTKDQ